MTYPLGLQIGTDIRHHYEHTTHLLPLFLNLLCLKQFPYSDWIALNVS